MKVDGGVVNNRTESREDNRTTINELHYHGAGSKSDAEQFAQWFVSEVETQALAREILV